MALTRVQPYAGDRPYLLSGQYSAGSNVYEHHTETLEDAERIVRRQGYRRWDITVREDGATRSVKSSHLPV